MGFYNIIKNHFLINKETIIKELETLSASSKNKLLCTTSLYNMELLLNYKDLTKQMKIAFNEYSK